MPLGPCFPGLHGHILGSPCQAKIGRHSLYPAASVLGLGWYSAHNAISRRRQGLPFCSGVQVDRGLGQCLPQPRGDPTGSLHTARALGWGVMGNCPSFSGIPLASANAATSWRKTASDCPFLHKDVSASPGPGTWWQANVCPMDRWPRSCCPLGPRGSGQACLQPRLLPQSGACTPALVVPWCLLSSQASDSLHRERVTLVLPPACCSCHGRLSCFTTVSRQQGQWLLLVSRAACCAFPRHAAGERGDIRVPFLKAVSTGATTFLSQPEGMTEHRGFCSMRVYYNMLWRRLSFSQHNGRNPERAKAACPRPPLWESAAFFGK